MPDKPRRIDLSPEDLKALLERIKLVVSDQDYEAIMAMAETIEALNQVKDQKAVESSIWSKIRKEKQSV